MSRPLAEVVIERLGAGGDGIASHDGGPLFVAGALPGERVKVRLGDRRGEGRAAAVVERLSSAASRVEPHCRHFGRCGSCAVQHLSGPASAA